MKKLLAILLACSAMTFSLAGCGDDDDKFDKNKESSGVSDSSGSESSKDESDSKKDESSEKEESKDDESSSKKDESSEDESSKKDEESSSSEADSSSSQADSSTSESSSAPEESSDSESSETKTPVVSDEYIDPAIVGKWYSEELGGSLVFSAEGMITMEQDYSELMYFSNGKFNMSGMELGYDYDGTNLRVAYSYEDLGIELGTDETGASLDEEIELLTIKRKGAADKASIDGEYDLVSGELYDQLVTLSSTESYTPYVGFSIDGEKFSIAMEMCEYSAKDGSLKMFGDGVSAFGAENGEACEYKVTGDTIAITVEGETEEFKKVK